MAEQYAFGDFEFIGGLKGRVDITCQHGRYSRRHLERIVGSNATFLTILRDPVQQFVSLWHFFGYNRAFRTSLRKWIRFHTE